MLGPMETPTGLNSALPRPDDPLLLGGRYVVGERIAAGGMGSIHRGYDTRMEREAAIKTLHPHLSEDEAVRARFHREAQMAARLINPNVVAVFDQGDDPMTWIVMEYIDGPSLQSLLQVNGPLPPATVRSLMHPLALALAQAHSQGIVHRDIKPQNVLISTDGIPKLVDFGIAAITRGDAPIAEDDLVGSAHYLSPEVIHGDGASPASDQYAFGVMTYELLTGSKPLPATTTAEILRRHAQEAIPAPSQLMPGIEPALDQVVLTATALRVEDRYPDMHALAQALAQAVPGADTPVVLATMGNGQHTMMLRRDQLPAFIPPSPTKRLLPRVAMWLSLVILVVALWYRFGSAYEVQWLLDLLNS